ncbi:MAG: hypothetical protein IPP61_20705 [Cytophagaceae bacterium]|nr:hypothetical protein [Cytophagaceae bacterium]
MTTQEINHEILIKKTSALFGLREIAFLLFIAFMSTSMQSCDKPIPIDPVKEENPNALTADELKILAPNKDGTPKSFNVDIKTANPRYDMPGMMKIEVEVVNAKTGDIKITPIIYKAPIETSLRNAYEDDKDQYGTGANIALGAERIDKSEYALTSTFSILLFDDNNPATPSPDISKLPEFFTIDELVKYYPLSSGKLVKSYTINKTDKFILILETRKVGKQFYYGKIYLNIIEQTTLANTGK